MEAKTICLPEGCGLEVDSTTRHSSKMGMQPSGSLGVGSVKREETEASQTGPA